MSWKEDVEELRRREALAREMGGPAKVDRQHAAGRLTIRERIDRLVDPDSFREIGALAGSASYSGSRLTDFTPANVVGGTARVDGRRIVVAGDDFTVRGGASDGAVAGKQAHFERMANALRLPIVRLIEGTGGGGSVKSLHDLGATYVPVNPAWDTIVENLSIVPVAGAGLGPVAGLGAARLVASHFCVMVRETSQLFVAGPPVVRHGVGQSLTKEELGGSRIHDRSGAVDLWVDDEEAAFFALRKFLSYLPPSAWGVPPVMTTGDPQDRREEWLIEAVPRDRRRVYDVRAVMAAIFDRGSIFEHCRYGGATITALARLGGHAVGVVAGDPTAGGGGLTALGADALTRLVDMCSTFNLPVVVLTDQPGIAIGVDAERAGTIRIATRATFAVYQAVVPVAEVIVRRVFGVGGAAMTKRHAFVARWAWPSADWGSLPPEGGIEAAYRAELEAASDPSELRARIAQELEDLRSPFRTAERFGVEEIIDPRETRERLCEWVVDAYRLLPERLGPKALSPRP